MRVALQAVCVFFLCVPCFGEGNVPVTKKEERKSRLFHLNEASGEPSFVQETTIETDASGIRNWNSRITDSKGELIMTEKARMTDSEMIYQYVEQLQIKEAYELEVQGQKARFKTFKILDDGKTKVLEENQVKLTEPFIMGPLTESFIRKNYDALAIGKTVRTDFGVFEIQKMIRFQFNKVDEKEKSIVVQMKPNNVFISMLVSPMILEVSKEEKKVIRYKGRTPLRQRIEGSWKPWDSEILTP